MVASLVKKIITLPVFLTLLAVSSCACVTGDFGNGTESASLNVPFEVNVNVGGPFLPGERIMYGIGIINHSSANLTLAPLHAPMFITRLDTGEIVYSSPGGRGSYILDPKFSFLPNKGFWDQLDDDGRQVPPGRYEITHAYTAVNQETSQSYSVTASDDFVIVEPDSAMSLELTPDLAVTMDNMTVTLTRLTLTAAGGEVSFFATPPGYKLPPPEAHMTDYEVWNDSSLTFQQDGRIVHKTVQSGMWDPDGIEASWDIGPVAHGTRELTFIVTRFAGREGPWIFTVSLE